MSGGYTLYPLSADGKERLVRRVCDGYSFELFVEMTQEAYLTYTDHLAACIVGPVLETDVGGIVRSAAGGEVWLSISPEPVMKRVFGVPFGVAVFAVPGNQIEASSALCTELEALALLICEQDQANRRPTAG